MLKKILLLVPLFFFLEAFTVSNSHTSFIGSGQFRWEFTLEPGQYLFNSQDLYFFDTGINCYLFKYCPDLDSIFEATADTLVISKARNVKYQAYLFTDNYEYIFVQIDKKQGWIRHPIPIEEYKKAFLKGFLVSRFGEPRRTSYVEVIPFKNPNKVFVSSTDDWFIGNLENKSVVQIGTKGGRLEACQMIFNKNCVECYIDLGWGHTVQFDENGSKCSKKVRR